MTVTTIASLDPDLAFATHAVIAPATECRVRRRDGQLLAAEGERVAIDGYWRRRIEDNDVTVRAIERVPGFNGDAA